MSWSLNLYRHNRGRSARARCPAAPSPGAARSPPCAARCPPPPPPRAPCDKSIGSRESFNVNFDAAPLSPRAQRARNAPAAGGQALTRGQDPSCTQRQPEPCASTRTRVHGAVTFGPFPRSRAARGGQHLARSMWEASESMPTWRGFTRHADAACPISTGGGTRRVRSVRGVGRDVPTWIGFIRTLRRSLRSARQHRRQRPRSPAAAAMASAGGSKGFRV